MMSNLNRCFLPISLCLERFENDCLSFDLPMETADFNGPRIAKLKHKRPIVRDLTSMSGQKRPLGGENGKY